MKAIQTLNWVQVRTLYLRAMFLWFNNLYFWQMLHFECYYKKNILHVIKFTLVAMVCNAGLWFVTTPIAMRHKKSALLLLLPTVIASPAFFELGWFMLFTFLIAIVHLHQGHKG